MKDKWNKVLAVSLLLLALCSCGSPSEAYVKADRETLETVGKQWIEYSRNDPNLPAILLQTREDKLFSWQSRIESAEAQLGGK
jgi:hypothetical protein